MRGGVEQDKEVKGKGVDKLIVEREFLKVEKTRGLAGRTSFYNECRLTFIS